MESQFNYPAYSGAQTTNAVQHGFQEHLKYRLDDIISQITSAACKKSFLVSKQNKYLTVPVENIAFFYIRVESLTMVCMDLREYKVNNTLDQIQNLLTGQQFFRINRQCLVNFRAIKEVERYFARKLSINLIIRTVDKLIVTKEKAPHFLQWLETR